MQEESKTMESNLRDIYYVLFRHKWKAVAFFLLVMVSITLLVAIKPNYYRADAMLLLKPGRENIAIDPRITAGATTQIRLSSDLIYTEMEILKNRELAEKIVEDIGVEVILFRPEDALLADSSFAGLADNIKNESSKIVTANLDKTVGLYKNLEPADQIRMFEKATSAIMQSTQVQPKPASNVIYVVCQAYTPQLAYAMISKLIDFYLKQRKEIYSISGSYEFFDKQIESIQDQIVVIEDSLSKLKECISGAYLDAGRVMLIDEIGSIKDEIKSTDVKISVSKRKIEELQDMLNNLPEMIEMGRTAGIDNEVFIQLRQTLDNLQLNEQELLSKYVEDSPIIRQLLENIRQRKAEIIASLNAKDTTNTQVAQGVNETFQQFQTNLLAEKLNLSSLQVQSEILKMQLDEAQKDLDTLDKNEPTILKLERDRTVLIKSFTEYTDKREQARIDQILQEQLSSNIIVVQSPNFPHEKSGPQKKRNVFAGFFFAFFGSIGLAFVLEYLDNTIRTPEDVRKKLNLNTLVVIADCPQKKAFR